ncbi:hypothetical protein JQK87_33005 [Streptomyces sp. G44]|uniref:hypothetical protein n=1 Tax=Streptomyces sp. G44 TaxID=2807632 RepID=UPI00195F52F9|nr:hypothetical protein [Streptomyces sp. G44]MBM7173127.1 hypothetical protein [Streptomyces sp. G44]
MKRKIKMFGAVGAVAVIATLSSAGSASAGQRTDSSPLATCSTYVDKETASGAMQIRKCLTPDNKVRFYGWMQKYTDDASCVKFRFASVPENYKKEWSVCKRLEYANVDTAFRASPAQFSYVMPN